MALATLALALALAGCSLALDFDDECTATTDCPSGKVCASEKYCVLSTVGDAAKATDAGADAATDVALINTLCPQLIGATEAEVKEGAAILIGSLEPRTGALSATGRPIEQAIFLAVEEINQIGGVDGKKLAVLACDDGTSDSDIAERSARHLAEVGHVAAIVGPAASTTVLEVFNKVAHEAGILLISPSATSPALTDLADDDLLWRTPPSDDLQGSAIVGYLKANNLSKVAVINRNDTYGNAFRKVIEQGLCPMGCDEATYFSKAYSDDTVGPDQSRALEGLITFQPEITVLIGFLEDGVAFLNLVQDDVPISKRFILTDGMKEPPLITQVRNRDILTEMFGTAPASPDNPNFRIFATSYRGRWGKPPGVFNAQAYDAVYLLALSLGAIGLDADRPPPTGAGIAAQLKRMTGGTATIAVGTEDFQAGVAGLRANTSARIEFEGASGPLNFNPRTGEAPADIEGWRIDLAAQKIVSAGVIYTAAGQYRAPAPASVPAPGTDGE